MLLAIEAWFPFRPEAPLWHRSAPEATADGALRFDGHALLVSRGAPEWLTAVRTTGTIGVTLEARTASPDQDGPARLLTISGGFDHSDLTVGQEDADLVVRVRRPGSDPKGAPPYLVPGVFADSTWRTIDVAVDGSNVTVAVDGQMAVDDDVGGPVTAAWDGSYPVALGDEPRGDRGWRGELRQAEVTAGVAPGPGGATVDLLAPGVLDGGHGFLIHSRLGGLSRLSSPDPLAVMALRALVFVPVGMAAQALWRRRGRSVAVVVGLATLLLVGKVFVSDRHPVLSDSLLYAVGGLVGTAAVAVLAHRAPSSGTDGRRPGGQRA